MIILSQLVLWIYFISLDLRVSLLEIVIVELEK